MSFEFLLAYEFHLWLERWGGSVASSAKQVCKCLYVAERVGLFD